jgi:serine protease AprX
MRKLISTILFMAIGLSLFAQQNYRLYFTDKSKPEFDPYTYFDQKAIDRRIKHGISLNDPSDWPVSEKYLSKVNDIVDKELMHSRWFNFVLVEISTEEQLQLLQELSFIKTIERSEKSIVRYAFYEDGFTDEYYDKELLNNQTQRFGRNELEKRDIDGSGVRVAIFDGGFPQVNTHPAFEHIRNANRIIKTWDFVKNKENVYYGNTHGRMTFACVGGIWKDQKIGLATGAEYMLAKTEIGREPFAEEEYWLAAAEWADKNGADIINSSLGYGHHRYFTSDMDGKTSLVVKAANMAARKGILVVNSAGNEATDAWETIITPADGDSVLAIGGIDPDDDYHISYSSYGPTADKRMKPNVSAYGHVISLSKDGLKEVDGTSFSSPLVAGFAACILQYNPNLTNMQLFAELEKSGHLYPYFDYAHGYGVPQASYFVYDEKKAIQKTFEVIEEDDKYIVKALNEVTNNKHWLKDMNLMFYNIQGQDKVLEKYFVVKVFQTNVLEFDKDDFEKSGKTINIHFRGFTDQIKF